MLPSGQAKAKGEGDWAVTDPLTAALLRWCLKSVHFGWRISLHLLHQRNERKGREFKAETASFIHHSGTTEQCPNKTEVQNRL